MIGLVWPAASAGYNVCVKKITAMTVIVVAIEVAFWRCVWESSVHYNPELLPVLSKFIYWQEQ